MIIKLFFITAILSIICCQAFSQVKGDKVFNVDVLRGLKVYSDEEPVDQSIFSMFSDDF